MTSQALARDSNINDLVGQQNPLEQSLGEEIGFGLLNPRTEDLLEIIENSIGIKEEESKTILETYQQEVINDALTAYNTYLKDIIYKKDVPEISSKAFNELLELSDTHKDEPYAVSRIFSNRFGKKGGEILKKYSLKESVTIQQALEKEKLGLNLKDFVSSENYGVFFVDGRKKVYLLSVDAQDKLTKKGLSPSEHREISTQLRYKTTRNKGFTFVYSAEERFRNPLSGLGSVNSEYSVRCTRLPKR